MTNGKRISDTARRKLAAICRKKLRARKADHTAPAPTFAELQAYLVQEGKAGRFDPNEVKA